MAQYRKFKIKTGNELIIKAYFADSDQRVYEENRKKSVYLKLHQCSPTFFEQLEKAIKAKVHRHSVDTFVHEYKEKHPTETIPSTKTIYRYISTGLVSIKPIDLPKMVSIRKRSKSKTTVNKKTLGKSIEERPETINNHSEFGHWEIDLVLGKKTKGELLKNSCLSTRMLLSHQITTLNSVSYRI